MNKFLSREGILNASDIEVEEVDVPEWGGTVLVRELTTAEVENFSLRTQGRDGQLNTARMAGLRAEVVAWTLVDEDGNNILEPKDAKALQKKSNRVVDRLFKVAMDLTGLGNEDEDEDQPADAVARAMGAEPTEKKS